MAYHQRGLISSTIFDDGKTGFHGHHVEAPAGTRGFGGWMPVELENLAKQKIMVKNPGAYMAMGQRIRELYWSALQYHEDTGDEELSWVFDRILGYGSFGIAALYVKMKLDPWRDPPESKIDELVVKTEQPTKNCYVNSTRPDISREAYHHAQLMDRRCLSNVFLRGFKFHTGDYSVATGLAFTERPEEGFTQPPLFREWRYYLEFCSRDTIKHLALRYKAWGYHLPEAFIWWTFYWLLKSCKSMDDDPMMGSFLQEQDFCLGLPEDGSYMLHNDMSNRNVFLQHEDAGKAANTSVFGPPYDEYPMPKMADFGLSETLRLDSRSNQARNAFAGTPMFNAPEKRGMSSTAGFDVFGPQFRGYHYHPGSQDNMIHANNNQHPLGPEANVWGVGFLVYILMTLKCEDATSDDVEALLNDFQARTGELSPGTDKRRLSGGLFVFDEVETAFRAGSKEDYSDELKNLVLACTRMQPRLRPKVDVALRQAQIGMQQEQQRLVNGFGGDAEVIRWVTRVAFDHSEWNDTAKGPFNFGIDLTHGQPIDHDDNSMNYFWYDFHKLLNEYRDPATEPVVPPMPNCFYHPHTAQRFIGHDQITYLPSTGPNARRYHQGPALHCGGRAWRDYFDKSQPEPAHQQQA